MSNLTTRMDELETQSATQHAALITLLTSTNAKLDAIATALGAPPATPTATLDSVVTALAAQTAVLSDMHLDTISMDQKLLRIRDAINPLGEALPTGENTSVPWLLWRLMDAIQPTYPRPTSIPAQPALDLLYGLAVQQTPDIEAIRVALGIPTGDATTTTLGLLSAIQFASVNLVTSMGMSTGAPNTVLDKLGLLAACGCNSTTPVLTDCSAPFNSNGMQIVPLSVIGLFGNVMVSTFAEPLPTGITFGTTFGWGVDYTELQCADWSEWAVFVGSDEPQYAEGPFQTVRYATNTWRVMSGSGAKAFSVSERGAISVQLCRVVDRDTYEAPDCYTGNSEVYTTSNGQGSAINFGSFPFASDNGGGTYSFNVNALVDMYGWTLTTSVAANIGIIDTNASYFVLNTVANTLFTFTVHTSLVQIYIPSFAFTYILCPPGGTGQQGGS